jgi:hypothetical protein
MTEKYKRIFFQKAIENLKIIFAEPPLAIVRDAAIKRYELCYDWHGNQFRRQLS